ncbi:class I SAM-dependent methyltransferase [secondary endosymbiont of Ctenarytaina eucalypti]|uniref:Methylase involved in ubiquinone/menaquinone biosynthesis n=1 Tax=secondary endosymbiont of Ctenarytaina eucalypti TaxID=1199245 RepID=J3YRB1_9ENTR|nr:class I SAM-dependent methyltransferase [secondary endosymbiont of Ctenarytaina eucalypti]AFP84573.1 methylase involved in ubiquinone/menaquinone biosynthesis [secondary endosymbiont of Ctenarytaina eucalypti]
MKAAQSKKSIVRLTSWDDMPYGAYYRQALGQELKAWWPKLFGLYLLKIGALSADLDTRDCAIFHQINVGLEGKCLHVIAEPHRLPFSNKSTDACLLAHTLSYTGHPRQILREVDRVLLDDGWLVITTFNPVSLLGLGKICPILFRRHPYRSRMYTQIRLLDWLGVLNFEILHCMRLQVLPWRQHGGHLLSMCFPVIGCLSLIIARKRTFPLSLMPMQKQSTHGLQQPINASTCSYPQ